MSIVIHIIPGSYALSNNEEEDNNMDQRYSHWFLINCWANVLIILIYQRECPVYFHFC